MSDSWLTFWTAALVFATFVVAIIAAFQDKIRDKISHPKLEVVLSVSPPDCHKTKYQQTYIASGRQVQIIADCYYFRFRVKNTGKRQAENVEVFASQLRKKKADGTFAAVESFLPMNLVWSHIRQPLIPAISPQMEKLCDLCHIIDPAERKSFTLEYNPNLGVQDDVTTLNFDVEVASFTMGNIVASGEYQLDVLIGSATTNPIKKTFEIALIGRWFSDEHKMLNEGVGIKVF